MYLKSLFLRLFNRHVPTGSIIRVKFEPNEFFGTMTYDNETFEVYVGRVDVHKSVSVCQDKKIKRERRVFTIVESG